jgi:hypothetical protein
MSTWDDTFWDYSSLTPGEESFANALKPEWQSVYEVMAQVKKDNKSTKNGKTGCLKLIYPDSLGGRKIGVDGGSGRDSCHVDDSGQIS